MSIFRRRKKPSEPHPGFAPSGAGSPSPLVAAVCERLGVAYGGFDALAPLPPGEGPGSLVTIHVDDGSAPPERPADVPFAGTGIIRTARVFADRTEVYDGEMLIATYDDLTTADLFAG